MDKTHAKAAIIVIGTELTQGFSGESNSVLLGRWLSERGFRIMMAQKVPDDIDLIATAVRANAEIADLLILTGGLGSTHDDVTREGLAKALSAPLTRDEAAHNSIESRIPAGADRGEFLRQAYLPDGAAAIMPDAGIAPGIAAQLEQALIFALPGVPREMESMLDFVDAELIRQEMTNTAPQVAHINLFGRSEPEVAQLIAPTLAAYPDIIVNILAKPEGICLTLMNYESTPGGEVSALDMAVSEIKICLGDLIFSDRGETLPQVVGRMLLAQDLSMAVAESITAGQIGASIASVPGASVYLKGGIIAYSNDAKKSLLGVSDGTLKKFGAASAQTAAVMAEGVRRALDSDIGLAVTGVAGPTGGTDEKPVGLVHTGLSTERGTLTSRAIHTGSREVVQTKTAYRALNELRHFLSRNI